MKTEYKNLEFIARSDLLDFLKSLTTETETWHGYKEKGGRREFINTPNRGYACFVNNRIVAISCWWTDPNNKKIGKVSHVTKKEFQRKGIGTYLLGLVVEEVRKNGVKTLIAWQEIENPIAMQFLIKNGWKEYQICNNRRWLKLILSTETMR